MLSEYKDVRQRFDEGFRRWYSDQYFDVIVWYDREGGSLTGFQVCYDKGESERAFTWKLEEGLVRSHRFVTNGPIAIGTNKMTSVLKGDAAAIEGPLFAKLRASRGDLGAAELDTMLARMAEYNESLAAAVRP